MANWVDYMAEQVGISIPPKKMPFVTKAIVAYTDDGSSKGRKEPDTVFMSLVSPLWLKLELGTEQELINGASQGLQLYSKTLDDALQEAFLGKPQFVLSPSAGRGSGSRYLQRTGKDGMVSMAYRALDDAIMLKEDGSAIKLPTPELVQLLSKIREMPSYSGPPILAVRVDCPADMIRKPDFIAEIRERVKTTALRHSADLTNALISYAMSDELAGRQKIRYN